MNPSDPVFFHAALHPDRPAIASPDGVTTFGMVAQAANRAAANLEFMGFAKGQRIAVEVRDPLLHFILALAISRIGAVGIALATDTPIDVTSLGVAGTLVDKTNVVTRPNSKTVDDNFYLNSLSHVRFEGQICGANYAPDEMWRIAFSSGSTGRPKAIGYTASIAESRFSPFSLGDAGGTSRVMTQMGYSSPWGFGAVLGVLRNGGMAVFAPDPEQSLDLMAFYEVNELILSPNQLVGYVEVQRHARRPIPALQSIVVGGARAPRDILVDAMRLMTPCVRVNYGAAETGRVTTIHASKAIELPGAVGHVFPWLNVELERPDGSLCGPGEEGRVRISGKAVVTRYLDGADAPRPDPIGEYFYPGDMALFQQDGVLVISGRDGYRINQGGFKIAPEVLEEQIGAHPLVADCCVSDFENANGDVVVIAGVVLKLGSQAEAVLTSIRNQSADTRRLNEVVVLDRVPRSPLGKIERAQARDLIRNAYARN